MSDTNLSQKFSQLSEQLATQHGEILGFLSLIRNDVYDIRIASGQIVANTGNTETAAEQINIKTSSIYDRLGTLNELYSYLTNQADQGLDLIGRINALQYAVGQIAEYIDGIEPSLALIQTDSTAARADLAALLYAIRPDPAETAYQWFELSAAMLQQIRTILGGSALPTTWEPMAKTLDDLQGAFPHVVASTQSIDGKMDDVITALDAIQTCSCPAPENPCDRATAWVECLFDLEPNFIPTWQSGEGSTSLAESAYRGTCYTLAPEYPTGTAGGYQIKMIGGNAVYRTGPIELCMRNAGSVSVKLAGLTESDTPGVYQLWEWTCAPGATIHQDCSGSDACFMFWTESDRIGEGLVQIGLFAVG